MKKLKLEIVYSQNDPKWKAVMLGNNTNQPYTIGNFGCKLTSYATYAKALGKDIDPLQLNEKMKQAKQFPASSGELSDAALTAVFGDIGANYASQKYDGLVPDSVIAKIKSLIDSGYAVFAEVDFYPATVNEDMHFIIIYGYDDNGNYLIADPWTGQKILLSTYGAPARVLYRIWAYNKTLPFEEATMSIAQNFYKWLIGRAAAIKEVATYLKKDDPDNTPASAIIDSIEGIRSQVTTLQTTNASLAKQVENKQEELARKEQSWEASAKLSLERQNELQGTIDAKDKTIGSLEGRNKELQNEVNEASKKYGNLNIEYGKLEAENKRLRDNAAAGLTIYDALMVIWHKLLPFLKS